jgi:glycerophosphoryl diester phosphodiesterase
MRRLLLALAAVPLAVDPPRLDVPTGAPLPVVIAHRGASGHRPEHTIAAYTLAVRMGADYIEPDLVSTKDGVLVCRHENEIGGTTDVATRFPDRRRTQVIDGDTVSGWFTEDFTLAELRTLRAKERLASRSHAHDFAEGVPTFDEVLALAARLGRERGRAVGVYPETKHPTHFARIGLALEPALVRSLRAAGLDRRDAPVFVQSFERTNLVALRRMTAVRLIQLMAGPGGPPGDTLRYADMRTPAGLTALRAYADGIGAEKSLVLPSTDGGAPSTLVADAHAAGLLVHAWTLRSDAPFLARRWGGDAAAEARAFAAAGVDGVFADFPDDALRGVRPPR